MNEDFKKYVILGIIVVFAFLSFLVIKPLFSPIFFGLILAYICYPFYKKLEARTNSKTWAASIVLGIVILIIVLPIILLIPSMTTQILGVYEAMKTMDIGAALSQLVPSLFASQKASAEIIGAITNLNTYFSEWLLNLFKETLLNFPEILFGVVVLMFTFFFALIEGENLRNYFSVIFPFSRKHEEMFYTRFGQVTNSVIYGHFIIGIVQGLIAGIGYFFLGVPNALLVTILTTIAGILPVIGPMTVWLPVDIFLFLTGQTDLAITLAIYGVFVISPIDTILRPIIVSKNAEMNSALALIGMIGGVYAFGIMGFVLGPLIIAALILLIEIYKDTGAKSIVFKSDKHKTAV